jgi:hypothetical protein
MSMRRAIGRWLMVTVVACATLFATRPLAAQGTSDLFPDPLTSAEIEAALDRVGVNGDARTSALRSFEEYVGKFLDLRKGDIEDYLQGRTDLGGEPSREQIAKRAQDRERLLKRISSLENQLFDSILNLAGDAGAAQANRERLRAERRRDWVSTSPFISRGSRVEVADVLGALLERSSTQLDAATKAKVDALLIPHEESLTGQCRKLLDIAVNEGVAMYDARAAANLRRPQPEPGKEPAPDQWGEYFRGVEEIRRKVREPQTDLRRTMRKSIRDTALQLADSLPSELGQSFRESFYARAYPGIANPRDPVPPLVKRAKELAEKGELEATALTEIEGIAASHTTRRNELTSRIAEKLEAESASDSPFLFSFGDDTTEEKKSESSKLLEERSKLDSATVAAITGTHEALAKGKEGGEGHELVVNGGAISLPEGAAFEATTVMVVAGGSGGDMGEPIVFTEFGGEDGGFGAFSFDIAGSVQVGVVQAMGKEWLDRIRTSHGLTEDQMSVLQLLYEDYRSKQAEIEAGDLAELKSLPSGMGGMVFATTDGESQPEPPKATAETTRRRFELKRSITERVIALDNEFFDGVGAAFGDRVLAADVTRLKHERERSAYLAADRGGGGMFFSGPGSSKAPTIDLAEVVRESKLEQSSLDTIRPRLDAWDSAATEAFRQRFSERMAVQEAQEDLERKLSEQATADGRPGEIRVTTEDDTGAKFDALAKRSRAADDLTRSLNEGARDDMVAMIPADEHKRLLKDAWNRKAWPQVFRDRRSVQPKIDMALAFEDLSAEQRSKLQAIVAEHLAEYRRIGDEMIDANEQSAPKKEVADTNGGGFDINLLRKRQETMNRLNFERDELNEKTFRRIRESLNEEQAKKLGEMPERKKRNAGGISLPEGVEGSIRIGG